MDKHRLTERREQIGLTLTEASNALGVNRSTIRRWELGSTVDLPSSKLLKYAEILQVSPLWILDPNEYKWTSMQELNQKECQSELSHTKNFDADLQQFTIDYFDLVFADKSILQDPEVLKQGAVATLIAVVQNLPIEKLLEILSFSLYKFDKEYGTKTEMEEVKLLAQLINKKMHNDKRN